MIYDWDGVANRFQRTNNYRNMVASYEFSELYVKLVHFIGRKIKESHAI